MAGAVNIEVQSAPTGDSRKHYLIFHTAEGNRYDLPIVVNADTDFARQQLAAMHGLDRPWRDDDTLRYDLFWINFIRKTADADEPIKFRDDESSIIYAGGGGIDTIQFRWTLWVRAPAANITIRDVVREIIRNKDKLFIGSYASIFDFDSSVVAPIMVGGSQFVPFDPPNHMTFLMDSATQDAEIHFVGISSDLVEGELSSRPSVDELNRERQEGLQELVEEYQERQEAQEVEEMGVDIEPQTYGEPAEFEICKDLQEEEVEPICPPCKPNLSYIEPNIVYHEGSYYNEKTCEYVIVFSPSNGFLETITSKYGDDIEKYILEEEVSNYEGMQNETVLLHGLKRLSKDYDKTQINGYFVGPIDGLLDSEENEIQVPLNAFTRANWAIIPDTGEVKVKLSVQKRYFDLLPRDMSPEPDEEIQEGQKEIELDASKFYAMTIRARSGIRVYKKFYETHILKAKGYLYKTADPNKKPIFSNEFDSLRRDLKTFRKHLFKLIREKGYKVNSLETHLPFANKKVDKIKIKFDNNTDDFPYIIRAISVKPHGCRYRQIYNMRRDSNLMIDGEKAIFAKDHRGFTFNPFAIIGNINDIDDDLQAYEPPTWEEFFVKYLVPAVDLEYGVLNSPLENRENSLACAMDQFPSFGDFLKGSLLSLETVFELLAFEFNKITCAEDTDKAIAEFEKRYGSDGNLIDQFKSTIDPNDGIVSYLIWALSQPEKLDAKDIIGSLTFCELDGLLRLILECLLGGIPFEVAIQRIVTKLLTSLTARHIGKLIGFLPASEQAKIAEHVQGIIGGTGGAQEPWSENFAGGISKDSKPKGYGSGQGQQFADTVGSMSGVSSAEGGAVVEPILPGESTTYALVTQDLAGATPDQVAQMNVDSKISQVTTVILEAYIDGLMTVIPIDDLITYADRLPITPLIRTLIVAFFGQCQTTPLSAFADLGMLIPKFKIDVCDPMLAIRIPKIPTLFIPSGVPDLLKLLWDMLLKIAISIFTKLLLTQLRLILAALDNILCQGLAALARSDGDFSDIFGDLLCDSDPQKVPDMLGAMLESMRGIPPNLAGDAIDCLINSFSRTLSKREMLLIAGGEPVQENVYERVARSINLTCPEVGVYFPDGEAIRDICDMFPRFIPEETRDKARKYAPEVDPEPICDIICLNEKDLDNWNKLRQDDLEEMGLSPEAAAEEIDKLNDIALQEFDDLLSSGVGLQDIIADEYDKLLNRNEPCDPKSPWNTRPEEVVELGSSVAEFIFTPIEMSFYRELVGKRKSILSRILSDTRGNTYRAHGFFASSIFSRAYYKDFENEDGDEEPAFQILEDRGFYPETIGQDFANQLEEHTDSNEYETNNNNSQFKSPIPVETDSGVIVHFTYPNDKESDYSFTYERAKEGEEPSYKSTCEFINSINMPVKIANGIVVEPEQNFGYTVKTTEFVPRLILDDKEFTVVHQKVRNPMINAPELDGEQPYAVKYFKQYLKEKTGVSLDVSNLYDNIFNSLFKYVNGILVNGDGFLFGAQQDTLDLETVEYQQQDGSEYDHDEEERILGKFSDDRVFALDPKVHGGYYSKPKIYIKPIENKGWVHLYDAFSNFDPECEESDEKMLPFNDIKKYHDSLLGEIPVDKRLYQHPDCRKDIPFDRVFSVEISALMDALVRTTILCYATELSMKTMSALLYIRWKPENYGPMFSQMLFTKMKNEFINEVGRGRTKNNKKIRRHRYWCLFMEQVAQCFQRQVDLGLITPTEKEEMALREIFLVRKRYKYPDRDDIRRLRKEDGVFNMKFEIGDFVNFKLDETSYKDPEQFYKYALVYDENREDLYGEIVDKTQEIKVDNPRVRRLKRFRLQTKVYAIRTVEDSVKVLFEGIVSQELDRYMKRLNRIIPPQINDIRHYMFNQSLFFKGTTLTIGTTDAESLYSGGQRTGFGEIIEVSSYGEDIMDTLSPTATMEQDFKDKGGFIVERYVRINEKTDEEREDLDQVVIDFLENRDTILDSSTGKPDFYGITTLEKFRSYITDNTFVEPIGKLSDYFHKTPAHFGIRISYVFPEDFKQYGDGYEEDLIKQEKTYKMGNTVSIPFASFEHPFVDETIGQFTSEESLNNYDNYCLVKNLVETPEFKLIFDKIFPLTAPISFVLAALHTSFYNSIGADDGWKDNRAKRDADQFDNIEDDGLKYTKRKLQKAFHSVYRDQEFEKEDSQDHKNSMFAFLRNMIPDLRLNLGRFGNRVVRDIDDCDDPIFKLLREK